MGRLTMRELRGLSPAQLHELAAEHGIDIPPRAPSSDVRAALVGFSSGAVTTTDAAVRGELDASSAPEPVATSGVPEPGTGAGSVVGASPLLEAAVAQLEDRDKVTEAVVSAVLSKLTVAQLHDLAKRFGVDVTRAEGDGDPVHEDYVRDLSAAALEGAAPAAEPSPAPATSAPDEGALRAALNDLSKDDLKQRAEAAGLDVKRSDGREDLRPTVEDYVEALVADARS